MINVELHLKPANKRPSTIFSSNHFIKLQDDLQDGEVSVCVVRLLNTHAKVMRIPQATKSHTLHLLILVFQFG